MKGIVPSLNTPFHNGGGIDEASLRRLVSHTIKSGCGGMLGLAVAGEHSTLTLPEKTRFIEIASDTNGNRIPFIVSVSSPERRDSLTLAKIAAQTGAAGTCVQLPDGMDLEAKLGFLQDLSNCGPDLLMVQDLDWSGGGLPVDEIVYLFEKVHAFSWLKIETQQAGPKYSAVIDATVGALNVCGGWAVTQLMDAMARGVNAFIPTGLESVYVEIYRRYENGDTDGARVLFERLLPILNFSNQHIDTSILFFKQLRKAEGLFNTDVCRAPDAAFDDVQNIEAQHALRSALALIDEASAGS